MNNRRGKGRGGSVFSLRFVSVSFSVEGELIVEVRVGSGLDPVSLDSGGSVTQMCHYWLEAKYERPTDRIARMVG